MDNKNWPHEAPSTGRHGDANTEPQAHSDPQALGQTLAGEGSERGESKQGQEIEEKDAQADGPVAETRTADFELPSSPGRAKYFSEHNFMSFKPLDHRVPELFLPIGLVERLFQQEQDQLSRESEERLARMEARRREQEAERERAEQERKRLEQEQAKAKTAVADKAGGPKGSPEAFRQALEKTPKKRRLQVYSLDAVEKLRSTANTADTDVVKRSDAIGRLLIERGPYANPVVTLDELDKAQTMGSSSGRAMSPTTVLHSLLEPVSAAHVRDNSLELELDASLISWIATANYPWWVPATLRSRFKEFLIAPPDAEQAIQLSTSVVKNALKVAGFDAGQVDRRIVVALAHLSAREIFQRVMAAAAVAARRGTREIEMQDLPRDDLMDGTESNERQTSLH
ncbi:hypothetical protein [Hydrogenophaga borbori]|uniref:hypothetical protein n=1 Tax=Hydrogenophaga borbori TaxID=2294117 RepID=UPI00301E1A8B